MKNDDKPKATRRRVQISESHSQHDEEHPHERWGDAAATTEGEPDYDTDSKNRTVRRKSRKELERVHFQMVNDRVVEDITVEVLYKPHTLTLLFVVCAVLVYIAITGTVSETEKNIYDGCMGTLALFLIISALAFPNGPFIRPHPVLWRIIFGLSVVYLMILQFTLFQSYDDVKRVLTWLDPKGLGASSLDEKDYAINCSDVSLARIWSHCDIFAVGHFLGWAMKALLIRHSILCWYISIAWELTEIVFTNMLPNFAECWWDALILDVLVCNGLGIWFGLQVCKFFDARQFHWESIMEAKGHRAKFKRAVLQFTPENWSKTEWFGVPALKRTVAVYLFVMIWLLTELNTFFLKHVFAVDTKHGVVFWRLILIAWISAPSIRQYYTYATDPLVKRLGMQCWVYCAITALEAAICVKFGRNMFPLTDWRLLIFWLVFLVLGTWVSIWLSVWWAYTPFADTKKEVVGGETRMTYLDSSHENLGSIHDDVRRRRRDLGFSESDVY